MIVVLKGTNVTLGEFVRQRRYRLGLKQEQVAQRMGEREKGWVSLLENGRILTLPEPDTIARLARALECTEAELIAAAGYNVEPAESEREAWGWQTLTPEQERAVRAIIEQFRSRDE